MGNDYVLLYRMVKCDKGCKTNHINILKDHGVVKVTEDGDLPLLQGNDNNFIFSKGPVAFKGCTSEVNPVYAAKSPYEKGLVKAKHLITGEGYCKCVPLIPAPWINTNMKAILEGSGMLNESCKLVCAYGGIITIEKEE